MLRKLLDAPGKKILDKSCLKVIETVHTVHTRKDWQVQMSLARHVLGVAHHRT